MKASPAQAARRLIVTDCEGPLTKNDNAEEIAERFIPDGAEFFARLSKYDDWLADVVARPGYNAGDTLRLLPPFLKAFEVSDQEVEEFSAEGVLFVPGAAELLRCLGDQAPVFIISTSYAPYLRALCGLTGFPFAQVRCTDLALDDWQLDDDEKAWLREWAQRIVRQPLIEIPADAHDGDDLSAPSRRAIADLDDLFWRQMVDLSSGEMQRSVRPIGGGMKLSALEGITADHEVDLAAVMYVGDSITDAPALAAVRAAGGVALSFNGNAYALETAEFAAASPDAAVIGDLGEAFLAGGREGVLAAVRAWPKAKAGTVARGRARAYVGVIDDDMKALREKSDELRRSVRGERIARLG